MSEPMAGAGQPRKGGWGKWVALGCGGALVLGALFAGGLYFVVNKATAGPEEAVKGFLAAAAAEDWEAAHAYFSAPLREVQPYEQFAAAAGDNAMFFKTTDTTFNHRSVDTSGAELSGTVTLESGTVVPASFKLVRENDAWKLIAYQIGS